MFGYANVGFHSGRLKSTLPGGVIALQASHLAAAVFESSSSGA